MVDFARSEGRTAQAGKMEQGWMGTWSKATDAKHENLTLMYVPAAVRALTSCPFSPIAIKSRPLA